MQISIYVSSPNQTSVPSNMHQTRRSEDSQHHNWPDFTEGLLDQSIDGQNCLPSNYQHLPACSAPISNHQSLAQHRYPFSTPQMLPQFQPGAIHLNDGIGLDSPIQSCYCPSQTQQTPPTPPLVDFPTTIPHFGSLDNYSHVDMSLFDANYAPDLPESSSLSQNLDLLFPELNGASQDAYMNFPVSDDALASFTDVFSSDDSVKNGSTSSSDNNQSLVCWDHGCQGRVFSSRSNLRRHQREKARQEPTCYCPRCGAHFSRSSGRDQHLANSSCTRIRRYSNGRIRPMAQKIQQALAGQM